MRISIRHKLAALSFALLFGVVLGLTAFFTAREVRRMRSELGGKATAYAAQLSRQAEPSVAFDDEQTAREIMEATAEDVDVRSIVLYAADGHVIGSTGEALPAPDHAIADIETRVTSAAITSVAPVTSREGPSGVLVLEMSVDKIASARSHAMLSSALAAALALSLGMAGAWLVGVALSSRLRRVQSATQRVASGDLTAEPLEDSSSDEVGLLVRDFNVMTDALRMQLRTIEETARSERQRLDTLVTERTRELAERNRDMKLILDSARQGFLTVDRGGKIVGARSRILDSWFGAIASGSSLRDVLEGADPGVGDAFAVALDALHDDVLPRELLLLQLPQQVKTGARRLSLEYQVIEDAGTSTASPHAPKTVLVMMSDATDELERKRAEAAERDLSALCARIVADAPAVSEFLDEAQSLKEQIARAASGTSADVVLMRNVHTLKGNAALMGLSALADACHALESSLSADEEAGRKDAAQMLDVACRDIINRAHVLMGAKSAGVELTFAEADALAGAIASGAPRDEIARYVARLRLEPIRRRLQRFAEQTAVLAEGLKKKVNVRVEANEVRLDAARWAPFWSAFVHVLRNAVDHGVEPPDERAANRKDPVGTILIRAMETNTHHVVEVSDDGAGIDFAALERRAREKGIQATGVEALFCDGVSSRDEVTALSGRGVGLGAARAACAALGGTVLVETRRGEGVTFRFCVPMRAPTQGSLRPVRLSVPRLNHSGGRPFMG